MSIFQYFGSNVLIDFFGWLPSREWSFEVLMTMWVDNAKQQTNSGNWIIAHNKQNIIKKEQKKWI